MFFVVLLPDGTVVEPSAAGVEWATNLQNDEEKKMRKSLLILTALTGLTIANYSAKAATDEDGYRILHKGQKIQLTEMAYGFQSHEDFVAFQAMIEEITPEKKMPS